MGPYFGNAAERAVDFRLFLFHNWKRREFFVAKLVLAVEVMFRNCCNARNAVVAALNHRILENHLSRIHGP